MCIMYIYIIHIYHIYIDHTYYIYVYRTQVDPVLRPLYLSDAEMKEIMGCNKEEYLAMKQWYWQ